MDFSRRLSLTASLTRRDCLKYHVICFKRQSIIPPQVTSGEKRLYQLKNKSLESRAKGHLILTLDVEFNPIRAAVRTVNPRDPKIMYEAPKFKRAVRAAK